MAGDYIGRYELIAELGRGGMATVFHAYDPEFDRAVAIKVMPREFLHVPDFKTRFQREARTIAALEHDAIVPVHDIGEYDDLPFLVMRYMAGGSLSERLEREPLSVHEAARIFERIAPAIDKAHAQGFVHRDLKPDNILFDDDDNAFIADFGIAKLMHSTSQLTGSGSLIGTPAYMSPEQIQDQGEVDHRSDLYSLGVILYETLTGQMPFIVDSSVGYFSAHLNEPVPDIRRVNSDLPPVFSRIIYSAMAKDKADRYQSAAELAADVARGLDPDAYDEDEVYNAPPVDEPRTRRVPYALIGGGALLVLVLVGVLLSGVLGNSREPEQVVVQVTATSDDTPRTGEEMPDDEPTSTAEAEPTPDVFAGLNFAGKIVYSSASSSGRVTGGMDNIDDDDIYVMNADGSDPLRLTVEGGSDLNPRWSPDGTRIVFASNRTGNYEIFLMNADGSDPRQLTDDIGKDTEPSWSPDGSQIVFVSTRAGGFPDLFVMQADGSNVTRLTFDGVTVSEPDWSPDGSQIVFSSTRDGERGLFTIDADGRNRRRLTQLGDEASLFPVWNSDGSRIAFIREFSYGAQGIIIVDRDGLELKTFEGGVVTGAVGWSPDDQFLVISSGGTQDVYLIHIETGAELTLVDRTAQWFSWADWWAPPSDS